MEDTARERTDAEWFARFAPGAPGPAPPPEEREAAFRDLVVRHGPTVYGVCRRVLGDSHAAEDAFQAAFLVLARQVVSPRGPLGAWLYGVAFRVALKARSADRRRTARERKAAANRPEAIDVTPAPTPDPAELKPVIDEELNRLPAKLRAALILCDVQGLPRRQAAGQLGCPESTLSSRLKLAREQLAARLARRGVTPVAVGGLAVAVPAALTQQTVAAATASVAAPAPVLALADEAARSLAWAWLSKPLAAVFAILSALGVGVVLETLPPSAAFYDDFRGSLRPEWRVVRSAPEKVSLATHPGELTIRTQEGTIHGTGGTVRPRNLYLIPPPVADGGDFTVTTRIVGFHPIAAFHQAGLILYDGDDDYLKFVYEFDWNRDAGTFLGLVCETGGTAWIRHAPPPATAGSAIWLRLRKRGSWYEFASKGDAGEFTVHGTVEWHPRSPRRIGLIAKNGGTPDIPEIEARFDFFEVQTP